MYLFKDTQEKKKLKTEKKITNLYNLALAERFSLSGWQTQIGSSVSGLSSNDCWFDPSLIFNFSAESYLVTANTDNAPK